MNEMCKSYKGLYGTNTKEIPFKEREPQEVMKSVFKERKENFYECLMKKVSKHS